MSVLETERLVLRPPEPRDWPAFHAFFHSDRCEWVGGQGSAGEVWRGFAAELGHWQIRGYGMFTMTEKGGDDSALGLVGPWFPGGWPERELGWILFAPSTEGKGYAREAALACRAHAYDTLGWTTAVSYIAPQNERSRALAERIGCVVDPEAMGPDLKPTLVYRHPAPGALA